MVEEEFKKGYTMITTNQIQTIIEQAIPQTKAYITDPHHDGQHFQAIVVSSAFENIPLVKQHQLVMRPLKEAFAQSVHALSLKTMTPKQWEAFKNQTA